MRHRFLLITGGTAVLTASIAFSLGLPASGSAIQPLTPGLQGIHKIKHVIVIMQENRSFDSYFGTYPGADGIPKGVCVPDPVHHTCVRPYVDHANSNAGGPH
ncbi:MAG TPA: alkaline phosphatase family protein, partial [Streptosporangiaceae bacterium]